MARKNRSLFAPILALAIVAFGLGGCGGDVPDVKSTDGRVPTLAETPGAKETVRGEDDPPIVTLDLGSALHERRISVGEELPGNIIIPTANLNAVPVTVALQAVLDGTDVSLSWDTGSLGDRLVSVANLSGPLPLVVDHICSAAKVFCTYRKGSLELSEKDTFIVGLPPISKPTGGAGGGGGAGGTNSMVEALNQLLGSKVQVDEQGGNIIYTTNVEGAERVDRYLEQLRNGRPLIVMQVYVWEVTLNKENGTGINWNYLKLEDLGPGFASLALNAASNYTSLDSVSGGMTVGAITTGRLNTSSLISFLGTQGRVQTISNPQITFVSGSSGSLKVGGVQRYISQVGQLVAANNTSGTSNPSSATGVGTNTVSTDSINTGLTINVSGTYENGVVFSNMDIDLTNLVSLNPTNSGGGTIDLPTTSDEKINTVIRVRPGDNLVMAGLVTSSDTNSRQGIPFGSDAVGLPTYSDDQVQNRELVIVVKPSVILFSDKKAVADAKKKEDNIPLPSGVLIDKDGSKEIASPNTTGGAQSQAAPASAPVAAATPASSLPAPQLNGTTSQAILNQATAMPRVETMTSAANVDMTAPIPLAPGQDAAAVNGRLMQGGLGHAIDDLLLPTPVNQLSVGGEIKP